MRKFSLMLGLAAAVVIAGRSPVQAESSNVLMAQPIQGPPAQIGFLDQSDMFINNPQFMFPWLTSGLHCLTYGDGAPTYNLGNVYERLYVSVPATAQGWLLSVKATEAAWKAPGQDRTITIYDSNENGCIAGQSEQHQPNEMGGLLYADASAASYQNNCIYTCDNQQLEASPLATFEAGPNHDLPLIRSNSPNSGWDGVINDIKLTQTIPANVPPGDYSIQLVLSLQVL